MEKLNIRILQLLAISAVAVSSSAFAGGGFRMNSKAPVQHVQEKRMYLFGYGGITTGTTLETTGNWDVPGNYYEDEYVPNPVNLPIDFDLQNGSTFGGGIGIFSNLFGGSRFEFEGSHSSNDINGVQYTGFALPADMEFSTNAVFFNMLKEVRFEHSTAYFGGGVGYASTTLNGDLAEVEYNDTDEGFAWQLIAGIDIPITDCLTLFTQYRYMVLSDMSFVTDFGDFTNVTDTNPVSHSILVGARVAF
ncbi:MAG: outer membrane beta-barrel protein [Verrucomicrobiales bacterium]|nr:outer membrane beta-barrel protein [Verrucomicrobiales bacterium]